MDKSIIKLNYLNDVPDTFDKNSIYFVKDNDNPEFVKIYITGEDETNVKRLLTKNDILNTISNYLQSSGEYDVYIVNNISEMQQLQNITKPVMVYVKNDNTNPSNINIQYSLYVYDNIQNNFLKIFPNNQIASGSVNWNDILNKPLSTVNMIDYSTIRNSPSVSNYYVVTSLPSTGEYGSLYYNMSNNRLFKFVNNRYIEIDWKIEIQSAPEFRDNRMRINSFGDLEISPNGSNWYRVYPLVGANVFNVVTVDNTNYSFIYYLPIGCIVNFSNVNHLPICYISNSRHTYFKMNYINNFRYGAAIGIRPSGISISNGIIQWVQSHLSTPAAGQKSGLNFIPILEQSAISENYAFTDILITNNQQFYSISNGLGDIDILSICLIAKGNASSLSYWLGTFHGENGTQFSMDSISVLRMR